VIPHMFAELLDSYVDSAARCLDTAESASGGDTASTLGNEAFSCMLRSGAEFVRLWNQTCDASKYPLLASKMEEFTSQTEVLVSNLPNPVASYTEKNIPMYTK